MDLLFLHGANFDDLCAKAEEKIAAGEFPVTQTGVMLEQAPGNGKVKHRGWCDLCGENKWFEGEPWWRLTVEGSERRPLELHIRCYCAWHATLRGRANA